MGRITVNLNETEQRLKEMIKDLIITVGNPYYKRSESEVAKMILEPALLEEHQKYIKGENRPLAK